MKNETIFQLIAIMSKTMKILPRFTDVGDHNQL